MQHDVGMSGGEQHNEVIERCLAFCREHGVTERGMAIAEEAMRSDPARRVDSRSMSPNYTTRFPSQKMGVVVQAESRTIELASIYMKEFEKGVLGYWDQPGHKVDLRYKSGKRTVRVQATMDFFVVSEGFIGFEEDKPAEQLAKLCEKSPGRYRYNDKTEKYEIPPLDDYLDGTGLGSRVVSDQDIETRYVENLAFLYDFAADPFTPEYRDAICSLQEILRSLGCVTIGEVEKKLSIAREQIFKAIWDGELAADLEGSSLNEPEQMPIAISKQDLIAPMLDEPLIAVDRLPEGSPAAVQEAVQRYKFILPLLEKECTADEAAVAAGVSIRTVFRWKKAFEEDGGIDGLGSAHWRKGNRLPKVPSHIEELMADFIDSHYLTKSNKQRNHVYQLIKDACKQKGFSPPSKKTFYRRLDEISDTKANKERKGAKSAYQSMAYRGLCDVGDEDWPFSEATRFLERCHIDHTPMDVELIDEDGVEAGKPWLTLMVDEYTSYVLAFYLGFDSPSAVTLMCVIRLMVISHEVFPESVVVDGGKEFESIYFEKLMAKFRTAIISRKGKPRGGGSVERFFGFLDLMVTHNLTGNTTLTKNVRKLSASHNPKKLAIWQPRELQDGLGEIFEFFNSSYPIYDTKSPSSLRDISLRKRGMRKARKVQYDDDFYMRTLPESKRRTAQLRRGKTIQVNRVEYWHSSFRAVRRDGETVPVRYDPFNLNHVYIFYKQEWIKCRAVRRQHRKASELEGAFLAQLRKRMLYLNEKAKDEARTEMAALVERLDEKQVSSLMFQESVVAEEDGGDVVAGVVESGDDSQSEDDVWGIAIPKSSWSDL